MFFPQRSPGFTMALPVAPKWKLDQVVDLLAVDLATVKNFLNIPLEDSYFDDEKVQMIAVAQSAIEDYCQMTLVESFWTAKLWGFYDTIKLMKRPFLSVEKIEYVDPDTGDITLLAADQYGWGFGHQDIGFVVRGESTAWPDTARRWDAVRIQVKAGFEELPSVLLQALLITIAAIDKSRADDGAGDKTTNTVYGLKHQTAASIIPPEAKGLLSPWTYQTLGFG